MRIISPINSEVIRRYTSMGCFRLAAEIHRRTGWKIVVVGDESGGAHAAVSPIEGHVLDVSGVMTIETLEERWGDWDRTDRTGRGTATVLDSIPESWVDDITPQQAGMMKQIGIFDAVRQKMLDETSDVKPVAVALIAWWEEQDINRHPSHR